jgi:hypothetical protein
MVLLQTSESEIVAVSRGRHSPPSNEMNGGPLPVVLCRLKVRTHRTRWLWSSNSVTPQSRSTSGSSANP